MSHRSDLQTLRINPHCVSELAGLTQSTVFDIFKNRVPPRRNFASVYVFEITHHDDDDIPSESDRSDYDECDEASFDNALSTPPLELGDWGPGATQRFNALCAESDEQDDTSYRSVEHGQVGGAKRFGDERDRDSSDEGLNWSAWILLDR